MEGAELTRFVAKDVRKDVLVVDVSRLDEDRLVVRTRTWNVLYVSKDLATVPPYGDPIEVGIDDLWSGPP